MSEPSSRPARERRWLLLGEDGAYTWLGRASDPDESEIGLLERNLAAVGRSAWTAVAEGDYWDGRPMTLLQVRELNAPTVPFEQAAGIFLERRRRTLQGLGDVPPAPPEDGQEPAAPRM